MANNKVMAGGEITREQNEALEAQVKELGTSKNKLIGGLITDFLENGSSEKIAEPDPTINRLITYCVKNSLHFTKSELLKIAYPDGE
jgi:hypothetical protein